MIMITLVEFETKLAAECMAAMREDDRVREQEVPAYAPERIRAVERRRMLDHVLSIYTDNGTIGLMWSDVSARRVAQVLGAKSRLSRSLKDGHAPKEKNGARLNANSGVYAEFLLVHAAHNRRQALELWNAGTKDYRTRTAHNGVRLDEELSVLVLVMSWYANVHPQDVRILLDRQGDMWTGHKDGEKVYSPSPLMDLLAERRPNR